MRAETGRDVDAAQRSRRRLFEVHAGLDFALLKTRQPAQLSSDLTGHRASWRSDDFTSTDSQAKTLLLQPTYELLRDFGTID